jgi:hypothetical protein
MSVMKRQREQKKAEKAARKRARRHGVTLAEDMEPRATVVAEPLQGLAAATDSTADESTSSRGPDLGHA